MYVLDLAAKLDQCAEYLCKQAWGDIEFPPPFGREAYAEVSAARHHSAGSNDSAHTLKTMSPVCWTLSVVGMESQLYFRTSSSTFRASKE